MKKNNWILLILVSILTFSCSKEDDGENYSVYGKWNFYSLTENEKEELYEHTDCGKDYIEIKDDNNLWTSIYEESCEKEEGVEGKYNPENNTFLIKGETASITTLDAQNLIFEVTIKSDTETVKMIYKFRK